MPPAQSGEGRSAVSGAFVRTPRRLPAPLAHPGGVEALEPRRLLAGSVTASLSGGHLLVEGTDAADSIVVRSARKRISVQGLAVRAASGKVRKVTVRQVKARAVSDF